MAELYNLQLIDKKLVIQLSENIEAMNKDKEKSKSKVKGSFEYLSVFPNSSQTEVIFSLNQLFEKVVGTSFTTNAFFDNRDSQFMIDFLRRSIQRLVPAGEYIYAANQPPDYSRRE